MFYILINCLLFCCLPLIVSIYWYLSRNHNYWSKRGVKGPWPVPGLGTSFYYLLDRAEKEVNWFQKFGKIYGVYDGNSPVLKVAEPAMIKKILVKDFSYFMDKQTVHNRHPIADKTINILKGDDWKRVRSIITPSFTSGKIKKIYPIVRQCVKDLINALEVESKYGRSVEMKNMFGKYTMDVLATSAYALKTDVYNDPDNMFCVNANKQFSQNNYKHYVMNIILPNFLLKLFKISRLSGDNLRPYFYGIMKEIIKERKGSNKVYNDFMQSLLDAEKSVTTDRDINDDNESHHVNEGEEELEMERKTLSGVKRYITENEIIANGLVFLVNGNESMKSTLSHITYELALNPEIQEKLYSEIMSSVDSNGEIEYYLLTKLPYLDAVISEVLRLHPSTFAVKRVATTEYKLEGTGITIYKDQRVEVPVFAIHRCAEYYPNPDQLIPERFLPENRHKIVPYTYLPFGAGPRNCVGLRLALVVVKLALVHLVKHFKIVKSSDTDIPMRKLKNVTFHRPERVIVNLVKR